MKVWLTIPGILLALGVTAVEAQAPVEIGRLVCELTDSKNRILVSKQSFDCEFTNADGSTQNYVGEIRKTGLDLSVKEEFTIVWSVVMAKGDMEEPASIAGTYVGAGGDAAVIGGVGLRVLVGGGDNQISLKPTSIAGVIGAGASLGIERFTLSPAS